MQEQLKSLATLQSIDPSQLPTFEELGISNIGDLLAFQPLRFATYVVAARDHLLERDQVLLYLDATAHETGLDDLADLPAESLKTVGASMAASLRELGLLTIADLARYEPYAEAEALLSGLASDDDDPYAPACVLPKCKKFTKNSKSYASFFREKALRNHRVQ